MRQDVATLETTLRHEIGGLAASMTHEFSLVRKDMAAMSKDMANMATKHETAEVRADFQRDMRIQFAVFMTINTAMFGVALAVAEHF